MSKSELNNMFTLKTNSSQKPNEPPGITQHNFLEVKESFFRKSLNCGHDGVSTIQNT